MSRAASTSATPPRSSRCAAKASAPSEAASIHWASSTRHRTPDGSAAAVSSESVAAPTAKRREGQLALGFRRRSPAGCASRTRGRPPARAARTSRVPPPPPPQGSRSRLRGPGSAGHTAERARAHGRRRGPWPTTCSPVSRGLPARLKAALAGWVWRRPGARRPVHARLAPRLVLQRRSSERPRLDREPAARRTYVSECGPSWFALQGAEMRVPCSRSVRGAARCSSSWGA